MTKECLVALSLTLMDEGYRKEPSYERGRNSTLYSREVRAGDSKHCHLYLLIFSVVPKALKGLRRRRRRRKRRRRRRRRRRKRRRN